MSSKRVLVVQEVNDYEVPMLPGESRRNALQRYLDTGPDGFYARTNSRESWVTDEMGHALPDEEKEVTP